MCHKAHRAQNKDDVPNHGSIGSLQGYGEICGVTGMDGMYGMNLLDDAGADIAWEDKFGMMH